jgi:ubiquinone/menaquinone biosynthesis C-methylase UbiE
MDRTTEELKNSYDRIAEEYAERYFKELDHKPLDRKLLDRFAQRTRDSGPVCDLGCGPGHLARYLSERGVETFGLDLSPEMLALARRLNPDIVFEQGNMLSLDLDDNSLRGIAAFYSIIHIPPSQIVRVLAELKRVLKPGGLLLVAFHVGEETLHLEELWGEKVSMDFFFFTKKEMEDHLRSAGFDIEEVIERAPYPDVEYQSKRAYMLAIKPGGGSKVITPASDKDSSETKKPSILLKAASESSASGDSHHSFLARLIVAFLLALGRWPSGLCVTRSFFHEAGEMDSDGDSVPEEPVHPGRE